MLLDGPLARQPARLGDAGRVGVDARRPGDQAALGRVGPVVEVEQSRVVAAARHRAGVGQEHDLGLEPLGGMDRHDPDGVARRLHVALDRQVDAVEPGQEGHQRGRAVALVRERQRHEFVDRVAGLRAEPAQQGAAAAVGPEQPRVEGEGRQPGRESRHACEPRSPRRGGAARPRRRAPRSSVPRRARARAR